MDALRILSEIRKRECNILGLYKSLALESDGVVASMLNISFEMVKQLKFAPAELSDNLLCSFSANTSTLFALAIKEVSAPSEQQEMKEIDCLLVKQIRAEERKIMLELRDICINFPSIAAGCCAMTHQQIDSLVACSASDVLEFCFQAKSPILKLRFSKEKGFGELIKIGSKPCFGTLGLLMDKVAC